MRSSVRPWSLLLVLALLAGLLVLLYLGFRFLIDLVGSLEKTDAVLLVAGVVTSLLCTLLITRALRAANSQQLSNQTLSLRAQLYLRLLERIQVVSTAGEGRMTIRLQPSNEPASDIGKELLLWGSKEVIEKHRDLSVLAGESPAEVKEAVVRLVEAMRQDLRRDCPSLPKEALLHYLGP